MTDQQNIDPDPAERLETVNLQLARRQVDWIATHVRGMSRAEFVRAAVDRAIQQSGTREGGGA